MATSSGSGGVPGPQVPIQTDNGVTQPWHQFFTKLSNPFARPITPVSLNPSPFAYQAPMVGHLLVRAGTVSALALTRGRITVPLGMIAGLIPMASDDIVTVTYTVAPTLVFIPAPGQ